MIVGMDYKNNDNANYTNNKKNNGVPLLVYDDETDEFITIEEHRAKYPHKYIYFM